ncbi:hypothetical protein BC833DRAFT_561659 [Globomyces pollinis-pini]|nr:hypothetical protein BC833DRAFT_561659 [Globomyces pollinis-pini]
MKYLCPIYPISFLRIEHRRQHPTMDTGHKPYSCPRCGRAFTRQETLRRHCKIHRGIMPWNRDSLMDYCRRYIESTHPITPPGLFPLAIIPFVAVELQKQPMKSNQFQRNQVMSIKYLMS